VNRFIELIVHLNQFTKISLPNALFELYIQCLISTSICLVFCTLNHYCWKKSAFLKTAFRNTVSLKKMDLNFALFLLLVSFFPTLDVNYASVTERAYSHSGRHEMNLDDEGFTEMSDCV